MYDVLVVGGGIASFSAALFAAEKGLAVKVLADNTGSPVKRKAVPYYPGVPGRDGAVRIEQARKQAEGCGVAIADIRGGIEKISVRQENNRDIFVLEDAEGNAHEGWSVIVASGERPRKLGVPGEDELADAGWLVYELDEPAAHAGETVAVVGGGDSGIGAALALAGDAKEVVLLEIADELSGSETLQKELAGAEHIRKILSATTQSVAGEGGKATKLAYIDKTSGDIREVPVDRVIVMVGMSPNSDFLKGFCELNQWGEIVVNPRTNATSRVGVFAAGNVTDGPEKEEIIAAGEGANAALQCAKWLSAQ